MNAKEELKGRIFTASNEQWIKAAVKDYRSKGEAAVQTVERGIILPLKRIAGTEAYAGGVCDARFKFVAGLRRNLDCPTYSSCDESYKVHGGG